MLFTFAVAVAEKLWLLKGMHAFAGISVGFQERGTARERRDSRRGCVLGFVAHIRFVFHFWFCRFVAGCFMRFDR
jgi:hypothetical protein